MPNRMSLDAACEYATPTDAVELGPRLARPRSLLNEEDYDVISHNQAAKPKPKRQVAVVNAYNHVAIVSPRQRRDSAPDNGESEYDVSTFHKQTVVMLETEKEQGNIYGHVDIPK